MLLRRAGHDAFLTAPLQGARSATGYARARAYRDRQGLTVRDREIEERLTDLTAVVLGFGVPAANHPRFHRPSATIYLLAVQARARRLGCWATCGLARQLSAANRRAFSEALRATAEIDLIARLGLEQSQPDVRPSAAVSEDV